MKVISLCDLTGNIVKPWADAGYECLCIDLQTPIRKGRKKGNITYMWGDVRAWWPESFDDVAIVFAQPPCTHLTVSGNQDWPKKGLGFLIDALTLVEACRKICVASGKPYLIENPKGRLNTIWRQPDYRFHPCHYGGYLDPPGDAYTKETCLWTGGGFEMPPHKEVFALEGSKMHLLSPGPDRANQRSETPLGFSTAVFEHMHPIVQGKLNGVAA